MRIHAKKQSHPQLQATLPTRLMQHTIENQAVRALPHANAEGQEAVSVASAPTRLAHDFSQIPLHSKAPLRLQAKLAVNIPGDIYEQEADLVSERVMRIPDSKLQRACACGARCPTCQTGTPGQGQGPSQTTPVAGEMGQNEAPPIVYDVLRSPGEPLDLTARNFFEPRFDHDFSNVRVHTNARAAESARAMNALAYTVGPNIVFDHGQYKPHSTQDRVLAHELTHVVQQSERTELKPRVGGPGDTNKREANGAAQTAYRDDYGPVLQTGSLINRRVQLAPRPPATQEASPQVKFGPLTVGRDDADVQRRQQIKRDARKRLPSVARSFVDLSFSAAQNGARTAAKPEDPIARENFHRALAGNLLWAATSLFVKWHPVVIVMSFVGASAGSGVASSSDDVMGKGEAEIANRLAQEADLLEAEVPPIAEAVADECGEKRIDEYGTQDQLLWRTMFPPSSTRAGVPWETKRETLTILTRQRVEWALKGFMSQWKAWQGVIYECSKLRVPGDRGDESEMAEATPRSEITGTVQALRAGVLQRWTVLPPIYKKTKSRKQCESERPFNPTLTFGPNDK